MRSQMLNDDTRLPRGALRCLGIAVLAMAWLAASDAIAADHLRIAIQKTGTLAWELEVLRSHNLDQEADLAIETTELATTEAGKIALKGGAADVTVSDWLWVTRERSFGDDLVFYPYSNALGAVMVPANSPIHGIADLKGKKLGVAGGPLDKSWLLLQALARRSGVDLTTEAAIAYGAPPLLTQKALQGRDRCDADVLEFLRRTRGQGHAARDFHERRRQTSRRQRAGRHGRLRVRRPVGATQPGAARAIFRRHA